MARLVDTYRGAVYPWHCDHMGHMNVMWYVGKFDEATWQFFALLGLTAEFLRRNRRGMAAVEQRIAYQRELYAGDVITVGTGALEVCDRVIRFVHEMRNGTSGDVAAVTVLTGVYLDTAVRKASAFPQEVKERAIAHAVDFELPWAG
ncbi:MAG: thioesterase [Betaproteobacteria bacterium]|nr:MAG: thioesterase [Betaproteobacteria bacterium]